MLWFKYMILINSSSKTSLKIFQKFLPSFLPIAAGQIVGLALKYKLPLKFIDEEFEKNIWEKIVIYTREIEKPYIFAFSVLTIALKNAITLASQIKKNFPDSIILFGGVHPSALPEEVLNYDFVDYVFRGEVDEVFDKLYFALKNNHNISSINGLSYKKNGIVVHNPPTSIVKDLNSLPEFPYEFFRNKGNYQFDSVVTSRGCPYNCIFCSNRIVTGKYYRYREAESIVSEINKLYYDFNQRSIELLDDNFLFNKQRIYTLTKMIRKLGLHKKMTFLFQGRADNIDKEVLQDLFNSGFKSMFIGIEAANNRLLEIIKKGEKIEEIVNGIKIAKEIGFHISSTFIYGLPTETHEDRMSCVRLSKDLKIDTIRFNNATPYPGTELYNYAQKEGKLNIQGMYENFLSVSTLIENPFRKIPFSYLPASAKEKELRRDILLSYLMVYLDFKRIHSLFIRPVSIQKKFSTLNNLISKVIKLPTYSFLALILTVKVFEALVSLFISQLNVKLKIFKGKSI